MGTKYSIKNMKPKGWWLDINHCIEACKEAKTLKKLQEEYGGCFSAIQRYGFKEECYKYLVVGDSSHKGKLRKNKKPAGWWDVLEHCIEACKECKNLTELHKRYGGCNIAIRKHGWQDECYQYLDSFRVKVYTREQLEDIAKKYSTYREFRENDNGAYTAAKSRGILEDICAHMPPLKKNKVYEDKPDLESVREHAKRYTSRSEFQRKDSRYYQWALNHGVVDEVCQHMLRRGNQKKRCIYAAEFSDKHAYIGLTYFAERRWADHLRSGNSAVKQYMDKTGLTPTWKRLTDYIDAQDASRLEGEWMVRYSDEGWFILNVAKTGSLGGDTGYTYEEVVAELLKYDSIADFFKGSPGHYQRAYRQGWMPQLRTMRKSAWHSGYTEQELRNIFAMFNCLKDVRKYRHAAVEAAYKLGLIEELTKDYIVKPKKRFVVDRFTDEELEEIAKPYKYRSEFMKANPKAYRAAHRKGIIDKVCAHMEKMPRKRKEYTEDEVRQIALKYSKRVEFWKHNPKAAKKAKELGVYEEVCAHMGDAHWKYTTEEAIEIAKKYKGRTELLNADKAAFQRLEFAGLLDEVLPKLPQYNLKWTDDARREAALQCKSRGEYAKKFKWAAEITREKGDWDIIAPHFAKPRTRRTEEQIAEICSHCKDIKELKVYDPGLWYTCSKHPETRRIAEKYFKK